MNESLPIRLAIKTIYTSLNPNDQKIADFILENPDLIINSSISDIASKIGIADSTFYQFTRKLGFSGYKEFKIALIKEQSNIDSNSGLPSVSNFSDFFANIIQNIKDSQKNLSETKLSEIADMIFNATNIYIASANKFKSAADFCYTRLLQIGYKPLYTQNTFLQETLLTNISKTDCIILFISFTELDELKPTIKNIERSNPNLIIFSDTDLTDFSTSSTLTLPAYGTSMNNEKTDLSIIIFHMASVELICQQLLNNQTKDNKTITNQ